MAEHELVGFAIGVLFEHMSVNAVGSDRAPPVTNTEIFAISTVSVLHKESRPLDKVLSGRTCLKQRSEILRFQYIAEARFGITGHPTIALRDVTARIDGRKMMGAIVLPDARKRGLLSGEIVEEFVHWTDFHALAKAPLDPDIR